MNLDKKDKIIGVLIGIIILLIIIILAIVFKSKTNKEKPLEKNIIAKQEFDFNDIECSEDEEHFCIKNIKNDKYDVKIKSKIDCNYNMIGDLACDEGINELYINDHLLHEFDTNTQEDNEKVVSDLKKKSNNIKVYILLNKFALIEHKWDSIWRYTELDIYDIDTKDKIYSISNNGNIFKGEDFTEKEFYNYEITDNTITYYGTSEREYNNNDTLYDTYIDKIKITFNSDNNTSEIKKEIVETLKAKLTSGM